MKFPGKVLKSVTGELRMLHPDILTISYRHRYEIKKSFKDILSYFNIDHFSLDLISPNGEMLFFSGTPSHGYELCARGYSAYDATVAPENYKNREFYWWDEVSQQKYSSEINYYRKVRYGFNRGFMMVRHWDGFYFIYSFAARDKSDQFMDRVTSEINELFEAGDQVYNAMRNVYYEYTGDLEPPVIDKFYPFKGGEPLQHHSHYKENECGILIPEDNFIIKKASHLKLVVDNKDSISRDC